MGEIVYALPTDELRHYDVRSYGNGLHMKEENVVSQEERLKRTLTKDLDPTIISGFTGDGRQDRKK